MKFDKIIANPPYLKSLHLDIIKNTYSKHCSSESVWLHPARWVQSITSQTKYDWLNKGILDISVILDDTFVLFDGMDISGDLCITYLTSTLKGKNFKDINPLSIRSVIDNPNTVLSAYKKIIKRMQFSINDFLIPQTKKFGKYSVVFSLIGGQGGQRNSRVSLLVTNQQNCVYTNGISPRGLSYKDSRGKGVTEKESTEHLDFNSFEEAQNFLYSLNTVFMTALNTISKCDMHVHPNVLPYMYDYTRKWSSKDFYEYFGLTEEEIKSFEDIVQKDYPNLIDE